MSAAPLGYSAAKMLRLRRSAGVASLLGIAAIAAPAAAQDTFTLPEAPHEVAPPPPPEPVAPAPPVPEIHARPASWLLTAGLTGSIYDYQQARSAETDNGRSGSGTIGVTRYLPAVVDDDQPRTLQPFLQRVSSFGVSVSGGGFETDSPGRPRSRNDENFGTSGSLELYLTRFFLIDASFFYGFSALQDVGIDDTTHSLTGTLGAGFRLGDTRIVASYTLRESDTDGKFSQQTWGPATLSAFIVFASRVSLAPSVFAQQDGGGGALTFTYYPTRNLDLFAGANGETGGHYNNGLIFDRFGGSLGFGAWVAPIVRITASYALDDIHTPLQTVRGLTYGGDQLSHTVNASVGIRLP